MPRQARIVIPDLAHHVTQRGNYGQDVFNSYDDYRQYCHWVNRYADKYDVEILCYCLMRNHVHFIVKPKDKFGLARLFNTLHMRYSQHINKQREINGHLWQARFYSCLLDDVHLYRAMRYVENNPVLAGIANKAWSYRWSSCRDHLGIRKIPLVAISPYNTMEQKDWKDFLQQPDLAMREEIEINTQKGLAVGTKGFINKIEKKLGRSLKCRDAGRPMK